ncbi:MAG TPA: CHRD domain-containing protein [Phycisphaerales bacterium]|nr:CHRD domain-containing protein [Phycisphaerales bacterium]
MRQFACIAASALLAASASAQTKIYDINLTGLEEVPPNASPATGTAHIEVNVATGFVDVTGTFDGLMGSVTGAHLHGLADYGENAGILIGFTTVGGTSGTYSGSGFLSPTNLQGLLDGLTYVNVHSTVFPGGEIRGQVVPTPASLALLGLGSLAAARRRR